MQRTTPAWRFITQWAPRARPVSALPSYHLPIAMLARAAYAAVRRQPRNAWLDTLDLTDRINPPPAVAGVEHVPRIGPCVILSNHYERPGGVWVGWGAIAISASLARHRPDTPPIRWVMTTTWADCYLGQCRIAPEYLGWALRGLAFVYGLILMPVHDLPTHDTQQWSGALALREIFRSLAEVPDQVVALHPEAGGFETMISPPRGSGRVLAALVRRGIPCVPTGVFEDDGRLVVRFGAPLPLGPLAELDDEQAAEQVMRAIARLVPPAVHGVFADGAREPAREPAMKG